MNRVKYLIFWSIFGISFLFYNLVFAQTSSKEATIILVKGDVKIQKAGKAEWFEAKKGMFLGDGDCAKTGKESAVEISFDRDNRNVVRLYENTTAILRGRWLTQIGLLKGRIRSLIRKLRGDSSFEIGTPTAVAGARGSGWDVSSEEKRDEVKAFEDEIFVRSFDEQGNLIKEVMVREGWGTFIERFQEPSELVELTDPDKREWDSWKEDLSERTEIEKEEERKEPSAEFKGSEPVSEALQRESEHKEQIFEMQEIRKVEERAASGETSGKDSAGGGSSERGGGQ